MTKREKALAAFVSHKAEIDYMLERLKVLSDDHFLVHPAAVNWGHVGSLEKMSADLKEICRFMLP